MASLAYPEVELADLRFETAMRLCGRDVVETNSGKYFRVEGVPGVVIPADVRSLYGGARRLESRLRKRLDVGLVALKPILAADQGTKPLRVWGTRWNRAADIRKAVEEGGVFDDRNFNQRYWAPSLAVIHLAAAWVAMQRLERKRGEPKSDYRRVISDPQYMIALVREAEALEPLVEQSDLKIPQEVLIRFRL